MPKQRILVAYTTNAGTTANVARMIADELGKEGAQIDQLRLKDVSSLEPYSAVVVGAPLILGWHREAVNFVKKNQQALSRVPVAFFMTGMTLTETGVKSFEGIPVCVDPDVAKPPHNPARLSFKENYATLANYLRPALNASKAVRPVSVGFFGGRLDMFRLKWYQILFVMLIIQAKPGGAHNEPFIREWAAGLLGGFINPAQ